MRRLHFFEVFSVANLILVGVLFHRSMPLVGSLVGHFLKIGASLGTWALVGIGVRCLLALVRRDRTYFRVLRDPDWIVETLRLVAAGSLLIIGYGWVKLVVPVYHPRLFDEALWELDRILCFGIAPTTFLLDVLHVPAFLLAIDWSYSVIFFTSAALGYGYFLSSPDRRLRIGFANGNAVLWASGAWLYLLLPSLGPAYRFPEIWMAESEWLPRTQHLQALLMRNYQNVLRTAAGQPVTSPVLIMFGIGAFPSLHVAFQTYMFLWMRRLWTSGEVIFGIFAFAIFLGSMITGWHYLVDGLAGFGMAYLAYRACFPRHAPDSATDDPRGGPVETDDRGGAV